MAKRKGQLRIGTSGYQYDHWKKIFYPEGLPKKQWFFHYAGTFDTVEINNTFYRLPEGSTFARWNECAAQVSRDFLYAVKYNRFGTHMKHLKDPEDHLEKFLERAEELGNYLGPILVQLPPKWKCDLQRLDEFLLAAPRRHCWTVEFRHPSWLCPESYEILRKRKAALTLHDMIDNHPREITADWVYIRYHGRHTHDGDYSRQFLRSEADRIGNWLDQGLDVYAYFNNDVHGHAIHNALDLIRYLKG